MLADFLCHYCFTFPLIEVLFLIFINWYHNLQVLNCYTQVYFVQFLDFCLYFCFIYMGFLMWLWSSLCTSNSCLYLIPPAFPIYKTTDCFLKAELINLEVWMKMWKYTGITVITPDSEILWSSLCIWIVSDTLRDSIDSTCLLSQWILL